MKILLIGDASHVHETLKKGLAETGHDVTLMSDGNGWHDSQRDIDLRRSPQAGKLGGLGVLAKIVANSPALRGNDVVLIHNYQSVPLKACWNSLLIDFLKRNNRLLAKGCYGDDPLVLERQFEGVPRYSDTYWNGSRHNVDSNAARLAEQRLPRLVSLWRKATDAADVLLPCLYEYYLAYNTGPYKDKVVYMPLPVEIPVNGVSIKGRGAKIKVLVGVQSRRDYLKGARKILKMVEEVDRRHPGRLDVKCVEDVPYAEYCAMLSEADVLVDQFYSFTPSMNSLAAMARGTVVIGGGEEDYYRFIGERELRPVINVSPEMSFGENVNVLERALLTPGSVERLSRQSIEFVRKHHDYRLVAAKHVELYGRLLQGI